MSDENIVQVEKRVNELMEGKQKTKENLSLIEQVGLLRNELKTINDEVKQEKIRLREEREKMERIQSEELLGGRSLLGEVKEKTKEEIAQENAREILKLYGK